MSNLKRIIAWMMIFSTVIFVLFVPVFASVGGGRPEPSPEGVLKQQASFGQWMGAAFQRVYGYSAGFACPASEDQYHYSNSYLSWSKDNNGAITYKCQCDGCGAVFGAYESDLKQSYDNQVAELPATGYDSDGRLRWRLSVNRFEPYSSSTSIATFSLGYSYSVTVKTERSYDNVTAFFDEFTAPISGNYQLSAFWRSTDKDAVCLVRTGSSYLAYCGFNNVLGESGAAIPAGELFTITNSNVPKSYAQGETIVTGGGFSISVSSKSFQTISGYLPDEIIMLLTFGTAAIVFIGIIKALRR